MDRWCTCHSCHVAARVPVRHGCVHTLLVCMQSACIVVALHATSMQTAGHHLRSLHGIAHQRRCMHVATKLIASKARPLEQLSPCSRSTLLRVGILLSVQRPVLSALAHSMAPLSAVSASVKLNTGSQIPAVGLGVFLVQPGKEAYSAVASALKAGYRHVDTAKMYRNEADVGRAIKDSGLSRESIFVTSKLYNAHWGYDRASKAIDDTLRALGSPYVDLMLLHHPAERKGRLEAWKALENAQKQGLCKNIGVSNFGIDHIEHLLDQATITPAVNQIELSPFLQRKELVDYCRSKNIVLEAYSPLCRASKLADPTVAKVARKHDKSAAQVLIRWSLQKGFVPLPKSVKPARQAENIDVFDFELDQQDMDTLDQLESYYVVSWDPITQDPV